VRDEGTRLLPMRVPGAARDLGGQELEFIMHSLVDLKLQVEELRRRLEEEPPSVEVVDTWSGGTQSGGEVATWEVPSPVSDGGSSEDRSGRVVYEAGMSMVDVERAAIEAVLEETGGNRRRAAERLGIGERTLYRKIKEFGLT
jgi:transcriptional regulator of acetoin/glycerol metabolism